MQPSATLVYAHCHFVGSLLRTAMLGGWAGRTRYGEHDDRDRSRAAYLFLWTLVGGLDSVTALDHICLQTYGSWSAVELEEETAGVA